VVGDRLFDTILLFVIPLMSFILSVAIVSLYVVCQFLELYRGEFVYTIMIPNFIYVAILCRGFFDWLRCSTIVFAGIQDNIPNSRVHPLFPPDNTNLVIKVDVE